MSILWSLVICLEKTCCSDLIACVPCVLDLGRNVEPQQEVQLKSKWLRPHALQPFSMNGYVRLKELCTAFACASSHFGSYLEYSKPLKHMIMWKLYNSVTPAAYNKCCSNHNWTTFIMIVQYFNSDGWHQNCSWILQNHYKCGSIYIEQFHIGLLL